MQAARPILLLTGLAAACTAPAPPDEGAKGLEDTAAEDTGNDTSTGDTGRDTAPEDTGETGTSLSMFLLAGQSNMEGNIDAALFTSLLEELGQGSDDDLQARLIAALRYWYFEVDDGYASYGYTPAMAALEAETLVAYRDQGLIGPDLIEAHAETYCSLNDAPIAPLAANCGYPFGPELMFGHVRAASGQPVTSLVKVARGGTTLYTDWRSPSAGGAVGEDYRALQARIASLATDPAGVHPVCAHRECHWGGFIWFQGENDSGDATHAFEYAANLTSLLADVRAEVGDPALPVIVVQTGAWAQSLDFGGEVAAAQAQVVDADANAQLVATDDLSGFYHYDPAAQLIIGRRIAEAVEAGTE